MSGAQSVSIEREQLLELERALTREWLETDGRGGFASSTVLGCNTRRYHGLLVTPFAGTARRHVLLSRFEDSVRTAGAAAGAPDFALSMARYRGVWFPRGHLALERFELAPFPRFTFKVGEARIVRELLLVKDSRTVLVRWQLDGGSGPLELRARPILAFREADALTLENDVLDRVVVRGADGSVRVKPYAALPTLTLRASSKSARFEAEPTWYRGVEYQVELERGYAGHEDNFGPGVFVAQLAPGEALVIAATIEDSLADPAQLWKSESARRVARARAAGSGPRAQLELGAEDFLYRTDAGRLGVLAGFPWFGEWGRDTFIALPGLTLARGRVDLCAQALRGALAFLERGLMPNIFGRGVADSHYGSADAALWFARAVQLFDRAGGDRELVLGELRRALNDIAERYLLGAPLSIRCDDGFLLRAGSPRVNATWMDAQTASGPVTPREGCAVEINALWYALLAYLEELATRAGDARAQKRWSAFKQHAGRSFVQRFWLSHARYLADVWNEGVVDARVRPNMVIAAALELSPLSTEQRAGVVQLAERELVTPRGLRTLSPRDPDYQGRYAGGPEQRDRAYHQGTVWPWLAGFYVEACTRAHGASRADALRVWLDGFDAELVSHGLNHIDEVHDGDPPHRPGGSFAQAWSTAEILRARALLERGERPERGESPINVPAKP